MKNPEGNIPGSRDTFYGQADRSRLQRPPATPVKKLLVICHGFPPYYGGAEHVAYHLAAAAVRTRRYQVTVLTSDIGGRLKISEELDGIHILRVPTRKRKWSHHTAFELLSFLRAANRYISKLLLTNHPDHVLAHFSLPAGAVAKNIQVKWNYPYSVVLHGSDVPGYQNRRFGLLYPFTRHWTRSVWRRAEHVIAVSRSLKQMAQDNWPGGVIDLIPNGVDVARFQRLERPARATSGDWKNVVVIAQLIERKGIQHLLKALSTMRVADLGRLRVSIYGIGPFASRLHSLVAEMKLDPWVTFHGLAPYEDVPRILANADLFVLPTMQEAMPLTLLEAMAAGCPIVSTLTGGIPDIAENEKEALLVPPADHAKLKDAILSLLNDPERAQSLGHAARTRARAYDWSEVWKRYERAIFGLPVS